MLFNLFDIFVNKYENSQKYKYKTAVNVSLYVFINRYESLREMNV